MRAPALVLVAALLAVAGPVHALSLGVSTPIATVTVGGDFVVGYKEGARDAALLSIQLAGGTVEKVDDSLRIAVAKSQRADVFDVAIASSPAIEFVERDGVARAAAAEWNGAQWNGAEWNAAEWNGVEWNGAQWNSNTSRNSNDPGNAWQWGLEAVKAPSAWTSWSGARNAKLCVVDSGVAWDHRDLVGNAWTAADGSHGYDAIAGTTDAYDRAGHGTHVAGVAAASVQNGHGISGMGNVQVIGVRALRDDGRGDESDVAIGMAWCARHGADVILLALAADRTQTLDRAIAYAAAHDVLIVASAGNSGGAVAYPASDPRVLAVAAIDGSSKAAPFSARGPEVDLAAPGVDVLGTLPRDAYGYGSGTSQAAAFVAGAAALVRDADAGLSASATATILRSSAGDLGATGVDPLYGHGALDVKRAVDLARA